jgi:hypothetical protein
VTPQIKFFRLSDGLLGQNVEQWFVKCQGGSFLAFPMGHGLQLSDPECPGEKISRRIEFNRFLPQYQVRFLQHIFRIRRLSHQGQNKGIKRPLSTTHAAQEVSRRRGWQDTV